MSRATGVQYNRLPMQSEWNLYYPSWMIADGEPDRKVGEIFEWFAVEFWTVKGSSERTDERRKSAIPVADHMLACLHWFSGLPY
jgi:hypothetical protein